jgi:hypothetical protein
MCTDDLQRVMMMTEMMMLTMMYPTVLFAYQSQQSTPLCQ